MVNGAGGFSPNTMTKERFLKEFEAYKNILKAWSVGHVIKGIQIYEMVSFRLGEYISEKVEILKNCLLQPHGSYDWLKDLDRHINQKKRGY